MKRLYPSIKIAFTILFLAITGSAGAQYLSFTNYELINGGDGQKGAEYRFSGVMSDAAGQPTTDCIVRIENISAGVALKSIDRSGAAGSAALQPVVEHMNTTGPSWIEFSFRFVQHQENAYQSTVAAIPTLAASVSGLNGFDRAQEFVEYDLGDNSLVVYETAMNNMMVTRNGSAFHAENKWGVLTGNSPEKMSLMNQQVAGFTVKVGVNRKSQTWTGTSVYNLELSHTNEMLTAAYGMQGNNLATLAGFKAEGKKETIFKGDRVEMGSFARQFTENLKLGLPVNWINQEVMFDICNAEDKSYAPLSSTGRRNGYTGNAGPANGSLIIRATCGKEFAIQQAFHMAQL
ncbi:MAG: hypothetical protein QM664_01850 [Flavihumibacter sp.]